MKKKMTLNITGIDFAVVALIITCLLIHYRLMVIGIDNLNDAEKFFNYFISIPTVVVCCAVKLWSTKIKNVRLQSCIIILGGAVLGTCLIEKVVRALMDVVYSALYPIVGSYIASLAWSFVVLIVGLLFVVFIKHILGFGKVVNKFIYVISSL